MDSYLLIITVIIIFFLNNLNYKPKIQENMFSENRDNIWMYWENLPGKKKSPYLDLCLKTINKHCYKKFNINLLDEKSICYYIPNLNKNLDKKLNIQQKVDYFRYILLYKYGGIWIDSDTIVINDLKPIIDKLSKYDFVGFGCHFNKKKKCLNSGKPYPANWVMGARKNSKLMKRCINKCNKLIKSNTKLKKKISFIRSSNFVE